MIKILHKVQKEDTLYDEDHEQKIDEFGLGNFFGLIS
jgi:hypothetical protein